jgi:hypothetical protein
MSGETTNGGRYGAGKWLTCRATPEEKQRIAEYAAALGIPVSEYMRRRIFGGQMPVPRTDAGTVRELRRLGGLLKHNFDALRQAEADKTLFRSQENLLRLIAEKIEILGTTCDDREKSKDEENDQNQGPAHR